MNKSQIRSDVTARLEEYFDSFVVIGKVVGRDEILVDYDLGSQRDHAMMSLAMFAMLKSRDFTAVRKFIRDGKPV